MHSGSSGDNEGGAADARVGMEPSAEALAQALAMLQQATALEMAGAAHEAVAMYGAAVSRCEAVWPCLSGALADTVRRNIDDVRRKMDVLRRAREADADDGDARFPRFRVTFAALPVPVDDYRAPATAVARVFCLMRLLARSMQSGAFVTPRLYVSKEVWRQDGAIGALRHVAAKTHYCAGVCDALEPLRSVTSLGDTARMLARLQTFATSEAQLRATLMRELGHHVEAPSTAASAASAPRASVWGALARKAAAWRQREGSMEQYMTWACNALEQCQLLERWLLYATQAEAAAAHGDNSRRKSAAHTHDAATTATATTGVSATTTTATALSATAQPCAVTALLHELAGCCYDGMCSFLLHDAAVLLQRYAHQCRTSVVELLPTDVRLDDEAAAVWR